MDARIAVIDPVLEADALVGLWNSCLGADFPLDRRLYDQQLALDTDERACFAARGPEGRLAAAALVKRAGRPGASGRAPAKGYLSFILVDPALRREGLGTALLEAARGWLALRGAESVSLGRDYYHFLPGLPLGEAFGPAAAFARARGFVIENEEADLAADLRTLRPAARDATDYARYAYRLFEPGEEISVLAFMARNFPGRWTSDMHEAFAAGMRPRDLALAVERESGAIVGFSRIYDEGSAVLGPGVYWRGIMGTRPGGLGPIGVDSGRRGEGLGLGLLAFCVRELKARRVGTMVIDWTDLLDFYGKMGFTVWKRYALTSAPIARRP